LHGRAQGRDSESDEELVDEAAIGAVLLIEKGAHEFPKRDAPMGVKRMREKLEFAALEVDRAILERLKEKSICAVETGIGRDRIATNRRQKAARLGKLICL
jgi:hypothetical protein